MQKTEKIGEDYGAGRRISFGYEHLEMGREEAPWKFPEEDGDFGAFLTTGGDFGEDPDDADVNEELVGDRAPLTTRDGQQEALEIVLGVVPPPRLHQLLQMCRVEHLRLLHRRHPARR